MFKRFTPKVEVAVFSVLSVLFLAMASNQVFTQNEWIKVSSLDNQKTETKIVAEEDKEPEKSEDNERSRPDYEEDFQEYDYQNYFENVDNADMGFEKTYKDLSEEEDVDFSDFSKKKREKIKRSSEETEKRTILSGEGKFKSIIARGEYLSRKLTQEFAKIMERNYADTGILEFLRTSYDDYQKEAENIVLLSKNTVENENVNLLRFEVLIGKYQGVVRGIDLIKEGEKFLKNVEDLDNSRREAVFQEFKNAHSDLKEAQLIFDEIWVELSDVVLEKGDEKFDELKKKIEITKNELKGIEVKSGVIQKAREDGRISDRITNLLNSLQKKLELIEDNTITEPIWKRMAEAYMLVDLKEKLKSLEKIERVVNRILVGKEIEEEKETELPEDPDHRSRFKSVLKEERVLGLKKEELIENLETVYGALRVDESKLTIKLKEFYVKTRGTVFSEEYAEEISGFWEEVSVLIEQDALVDNAGEMESEIEKLLELNRRQLVVEGVNFYDVEVEKGEWFYGHVQFARELGIVRGYSGEKEGYFLPGNPVSYAEALKMIVTAAGIKVQEASEGEWYAPYREFAKNYEFSGRITDWNKSASRRDVAVIIQEVMGLGSKDNGEAFPDVSDLDRDFGRFSAVKDAGIMTGQGDGRFNPTGLINRAEMAKVIRKIIEITEEKEVLETRNL